ncbi:MAG: LPS assembly protein LptD [Pseudomonadota bacterium]
MSHPLMLLFRRARVVSVFLLLCAGWARAQADEQYACYPAADGAGWQCTKSGGEGAQPPRTQAEQPPIRSALQERPVEAAAAQAASVPTTRVLGATKDDLDPVTGISRNPQDWFTPTAERATRESHMLHADLARALYAPPDTGGTCRGGYQVRAFPPSQGEDMAQMPIVALADSLRATFPETADLQGNVTVTQGDRQIVAPQVRVDYAEQRAHFESGLRLDEPGAIMQGGAGVVELETSATQLLDAQLVLTDVGLRGQAQNLGQDSAGDLTLTRADFTSCPPDNNGWQLRSKTFVAREDEVFATARGAVLKLKSVPIFYSPYLKFPISDERLSGFLFPNLSYSDEDGLDVSVPYYFNLAANYDATLTPRYISDRGAGAELELRHMSSWQSTVLGGALLRQDDLFDGRFEFDDFVQNGGTPADFEPADRWLAAMDHSGRIGAFETLVNYTAVSDADYFRDLGSDLGVSSRLELERRGEIRYARRGLSLKLWAQRFQRLDLIGREEYQRLPELEGLYQTRLGPMEFSVATKLSRFDRDTEGLSGLNALTGERVHFEPTLRLPLSRSWGFLNFTAGYKYTEYDLEQNVAVPLATFDERPQRRIGMGSVDGGLFFERELNWSGRDLIQTLEPRVYYLYQQYEDQAALPLFDSTQLTFGYTQLFRANRFSGLDRIADADQVSVGLTTRFIAAQDGRELFRASVGEIFYQRDRRVTLVGSPGVADARNSSALAGEVSAALFGGWRLTGGVVWDPYDNQVQEGSGALQFVQDNRHIFNLGYRAQLLQDVEQTDMSVYWPLTDRVGIFGRWNFDLVSKRTIEGFGGLEYSDCCLQVRFMARRFLDARSSNDFADIEADEGLFLQIVFKGLAGFGTKVESIFERGIRGYRAPRDIGGFAPGLN